jgi:Peptidase A4 family
MQGEEEFRRNIPYPLISTNIAGAFTSPPPPDNLDLEHASPETLIAHGQLWCVPQPGETGDSSARRRSILAKANRARIKYIVPELAPQPGKTHLFGRLYRADAALTNPIWAGAALKGSWIANRGVWIIPTVSKPIDPPGNEGGWNSSSWVGIDGFYGSNDVLQAGIQQRVDSTGQTSYVAWYEWFAPAQSNSPQYIWQTNIPKFAVSPGHQVHCFVQYVFQLKPIYKPIAGYLYFKNDTTSQAFSITLMPPPGATFGGNCIEWIMEVPDFGYPNAALPSFTPVTFTSAWGTGQTGVVGDPQNGDSLNIVSNRTLTSVILGQEKVTISYKDFNFDDLRGNFIQSNLPGDFVLDVADAVVAPSQPVVIYPKKWPQADNQAWGFTEDGHIVSKQDPRFVLDVLGGVPPSGPNTGLPVGIYPRNIPPTANQLWTNGPGNLISSQMTGWEANS